MVYGVSQFVSNRSVCQSVPDRRVWAAFQWPKVSTLWPVRNRISLFRSLSVSEANIFVESWTNCHQTWLHLPLPLLHIILRSAGQSLRGSPLSTIQEDALRVRPGSSYTRKKRQPECNHVYQTFGNTPVKIIPSSALNWSWRSQDGAMPVKRSCFGAWKQVGYVLR
jgi:hypothetical protein